MSKDMYSPVDHVTLTQFYGGKERGVCLQLTDAGQCIQLTEDDARALAEALLQWLEDKLVEVG